MSIVTLLTDFGLDDPFVGEMKAALLRRASDLVLVDLTHGVDRGNIREAAWILAQAWRQFPAGTCHLVVVDPGVGGGRRRLAAEAGGHFFVGPDNGVLTAALESVSADGVREIDEGVGDRTRRGTTFDGRDVFAPAAARIATGTALSELGGTAGDPIRLPPFEPRPAGGGWAVEIARVDGFGNLITVATEGFLRRRLGAAWREAAVAVGGRTIRGIRNAYADVASGDPLLTIGSCGTLEIGVNGGRAAEALGLGGGEEVLLVGPGPT